MKYLFSFLLVLVILVTTNAQPGILDNSFGDGGKVIGPNYYAYVYATAIQSDGKIIACGEGGYGNQGGFLLIRYNPDGSVDPSFGDGGVVVTDFSGPIDEAYGVVVQPDGKILAAGQVGRNIDAGVIRYLPNGDPDSSFGVNGIAVTELLGGDDYVSSMALQQDGKILVTG
ncbi:MAG TPA: delta-60 repeat domain-containing protein, partial [Panacibacter sp.]|nr:delta-60 repeat domain-containing protein [Panacibacter sp.]